MSLGFEQMGAAMLITFLVAVTPVMHWPIKDGQLDLHGALLDRAAAPRSRGGERR